MQGCVSGSVFYPHTCKVEPKRLRSSYFTGTAPDIASINDYDAGLIVMYGTANSTTTIG